MVANIDARQRELSTVLSSEIGCKTGLGGLLKQLLPQDGVNASRVIKYCQNRIALGTLVHSQNATLNHSSTVSFDRHLRIVREVAAVTRLVSLRFLLDPFYCTGRCTSSQICVQEFTRLIFEHLP